MLKPSHLFLFLFFCINNTSFGFSKIYKRNNENPTSLDHNKVFHFICSFIDPYYLYNLLGSFSIDSFLHRPILISMGVLENVITIYILLYVDVCVLYKYTGLEYWPVTYILKNSKIIKRHVFLVWRTVQIWQLYIS